MRELRIQLQQLVESRKRQLHQILIPAALAIEGINVASYAYRKAGTIHDPRVRRGLAESAHVRVEGSVPRGRPMIVIGNYISGGFVGGVGGYREDVTANFDAAITYGYEAAKGSSILGIEWMWQPNMVEAMTREEKYIYFPSKYKVLMPATIAVEKIVKEIDGKQREIPQLKDPKKSLKRILLLHNRGGSLLYFPGFSTDKDGMSRDNIQFTPVAIALAINYSLETGRNVLPIQVNKKMGLEWMANTTDSGNGRRKTVGISVGEVELPSIYLETEPKGSNELRDIFAEVAKYCVLYGMADMAENGIPEDQGKGDFENYRAVKAESIEGLSTLSSRGINMVGGFYDEELKKTRRKS